MATEVDRVLDVGYRWTGADSSELYGVARWGKGYFSVRSGHLHVHPERDPATSIDLAELVGRLELRGIDLPILIRFNGVLADRMRAIRDAMRIVGSKTYVRCYHRESFDAPWAAITIDLAKA